MVNLEILMWHHLLNSTHIIECIPTPFSQHPHGNVSRLLSSYHQLCFLPINFQSFKFHCTTNYLKHFLYFMSWFLCIIHLISISVYSNVIWWEMNLWINLFSHITVSVLLMTCKFMAAARSQKWVNLQLVSQHVQMLSWAGCNPTDSSSIRTRWNSSGVWHRGACKSFRPPRRWHSFPSTPTFFFHRRSDCSSDTTSCHWRPCISGCSCQSLEQLSRRCHGISFTDFTVVASSKSVLFWNFYTNISWL